jgi:pimeloyl-ACP methyl ester carboxylesterase
MNSSPRVTSIVDGPARRPTGDRPGYFVAGAGEPVVMLHSSLGSKSQWTALASRLATRFRVIALDLCGYGDNPAPSAATAFALDDEVRLVTERLDRLVASRVRVHVVGHSYGGLVALRLAQSRGDRVASLSLYEPVAFRLLDDDDPALEGVTRLKDRVTRLVATGHRDDAAQAFVDYWSGDGSYARLPLPARTSLERRIDKVPLDFQAAWRWPLRPADLRGIAVPTMLLAGTRSPLVAQRIVTVLAWALPNRRTWWFDAGHMAPIDDANRINDRIEAFVKACATRDGAASAPRVAAAPATLATAAILRDARCRTQRARGLCFPRRFRLDRRYLAAVDVSRATRFASKAPSRPAQHFPSAHGDRGRRRVGRGRRRQHDVGDGRGGIGRGQKMDNPGDGQVHANVGAKKNRRCLDQRSDAVGTRGTT